MNNTQLYLTIGIPSFLVLFSLLTNMLQINRLSDRMDRNYETLGSRMERLSVKMDRSYEKLSDRMDRLAEQQHKDSLALQGYTIAWQ